MSHLINRNKSLNEEFWQILQHDNKIIFRSFLNVYVLDNNTITKIESTDTIISCSVSNNTVYVNTLTNGIFTLKDNTLTPFLFSDDLVDAKIIGIANPSQSYTLDEGNPSQPLNYKKWNLCYKQLRASHI